MISRMDEMDWLWVVLACMTVVLLTEGVIQLVFFILELVAFGMQIRAMCRGGL